MRRLFTVLTFFSMGLPGGYAFGDTVFVTHAQTQYIERPEIAAAVNAWTKKKTNEGSKVYFLYNDLASSILEESVGIESVYSAFGEHTLSTDDPVVYLMGSELGACLQHTFLDLIRARGAGAHSFEVRIPADAVAYITGESLGSYVRSHPSDEEIFEEVKRIFSRFPEYVNGVPLARYRFAVYLGDRPLGSYKIAKGVSLGKSYKVILRLVF